MCTWLPGLPTACCSQLSQAWGSAAQDSASEGDMAISGPGSLPTVAGACQREGTGGGTTERGLPLPSSCPLTWTGAEEIEGWIPDPPP